jgi:uncharacterized membrane protein YvbJ
MAEDAKKCLFCGEDILQVAIKCKHCGSMLDGSDQEKKVTVAGVDPFAELHTPIKGKAKGKVTFIGKIGIGLGILFMVMGVATMVSAGEDFEMQNSLLIILLGVGISIASFLWARRPVKK